MKFIFKLLMRMLGLAYNEEVKSDQMDEPVGTHESYYDELYKYDAMLYKGDDFMRRRFHDPFSVTGLDYFVNDKEDRSRFY